MSSEPADHKKPGPRPPPTLEELEAMWEQKGQAAIRKVRELDPSAYVMAMSRLFSD